MATSRGPEGQHLQARCWRLTGVSDHSAFFRNLPALLPADAVLVLEGGLQPADLRAFIQRNEVPTAMKIAAGTVWPRSTVHHISATATILKELADLTEDRAAPEVCDHLHAYRDGEVLLEWYDAFSEALCVSTRVPQDRLDQFCTALGVEYTVGDCCGAGERK
jgi:hypothetical protein